eukprot:gene1751-12349_t
MTAEPKELYKMHSDVAKLFTEWQLKDYDTRLAIWVGITRFSCFAQLALDDHDMEEFLASAIEAGQIEGEGVFINARMVEKLGIEEGDDLVVKVLLNYKDKREDVKYRAIKGTIIEEADWTEVQEEFL